VTNLFVAGRCHWSLYT